MTVAAKLIAASNSDTRPAVSPPVSAAATPSGRYSRFATSASKNRIVRFLSNLGSRASRYELSHDPIQFYFPDVWSK